MTPIILNYLKKGFIAFYASKMDSLQPSTHLWDALRVKIFITQIWEYLSSAAYLSISSIFTQKRSKFLLWHKAHYFCLGILAAYENLLGFVIQTNTNYLEFNATLDFFVFHKYILCLYMLCFFLLGQLNLHFIFFTNKSLYLWLKNLLTYPFLLLPQSSLYCLHFHF